MKVKEFCFSSGESSCDCFVSQLQNTVNKRGASSPEERKPCSFQLQRMDRLSCGLKGNKMNVDGIPKAVSIPQERKEERLGRKAAVLPAGGVHLRKLLLHITHSVTQRCEDVCLTGQMSGGITQLLRERKLLLIQSDHKKVENGHH